MINSMLNIAAARQQRRAAPPWAAPRLSACIFPYECHHSSC
jgi:hypothetical protein